MNKIFNKTTKEEIIQVLSDPGRMKAAFGNAVEDISRIAKELDNFYSEFDDGMSDLFQLVDDPVVKKIRENLMLERLKNE